MRKGKIEELLSTGYSMTHSAGYQNILTNLEAYQASTEKKQDFVVIPTLIKALKNTIK